jgi:hypothetical protein
MKKIIFIIIFFFNILPSFKNGNISLGSSESVYSQPCPPPAGGSGGSGNGGGSNFWTAIGNFFTTIGQAIGSFFSAIGDFFTNTNNNPTGGENYGGEGSWSPPYEPDPYYGANGGPFDPWTDPYFSGLIDYYNTNGSGQNNPPPPPRYYIMRSGDSTKYYDGDTIYNVVQTPLLQLHLFNQNGSVSIPPLEWKCNDTAKCSAIATCGMNVSTIRSILVKVDSAGVKTLIRNPIVLYPKPIIYFRIGDNYNGEYGFDDSSHKHPVIKNTAAYNNGTEVRPIGSNPAYIVPWLSLLDKQTVSVKIEKQNLSPLAARDPLFAVMFQSSGINTILNNYNWGVNFNYSQLVALNTFPIYAEQFNALSETNKTVANITVINQTSDTIGKLNYSCQIPIKKKIVFIYVNTGTGYLNTGIHSKQAILEQLNLHSHNQFMRKWVLDTSYNYLDTLNLTTEYSTNPSDFANETIVFSKVKTFFQAHKNMYISQFNPGINSFSNDPEKRHIVFVFNISMGLVLGNTDTPGIVSNLFSTSDKNTFSHEMGHILKLQHTFADTTTQLNYNIPKYSTKNIMDYSNGGAAQNMFYFSQWVDAL